MVGHCGRATPFHPNAAVLRMQRVELANLDLDLDNFARSMSCDSKLNQVPLVPWPSANLLRWSFQADCDLRVFEKTIQGLDLSSEIQTVSKFRAVIGFRRVAG